MTSSRRRYGKKHHRSSSEFEKEFKKGKEKKKEKNKERKLLILDLDGTLIYSDERPFKGYEYDFKLSSSWGTQRFYLRPRPHLDMFLRKAAEKFDLAVWTASHRDYALNVLKIIWPKSIDLKFIYTINHCTKRGDSW